MLRRGGIGGSVGVWRGSRCPYRPSTASSPDPCPRATSHTVMDYARVDAHPRSMLHWAAKTNHQPLKGRSSHRRYHFNPILIPHRIVVTHTHRPRVRGQREISVQKRADSRLALASFFFSFILFPRDLHAFPFLRKLLFESRFTIYDRRSFGSRYFSFFFYRFNFFFFFFLFSSISFIQKEEDRSVGFFSRGDLDDERTRSINRGGTRRSDRTICQRFVALSNQKICLPSWLHVYGASTVCRHCIEDDPGISLKEDF